MRRCYLVCYDIHAPKRLRQVFKIMKGYGQHWQYSIFFCNLKDIDRVRLQRELEQVMNLREDQVLIVDMGKNVDLAKKAVATIGQKLASSDDSVVVV